MARTSPSHAEQETSRLYALPPEEFIKARNEAARNADDEETAQALRSLRKPSKAASLANLLSREDGSSASELVELGAAMRTAQEELDGEALRELSKRRRELVQQLRRSAVELSSESVSDAIGRQLEDIFQGVLASANVGEAFAAGRISGVPEADETNPFAGIRATTPKPKTASKPKTAPGEKTAEPKQAPKDRQAISEARQAEREAAGVAKEAQKEAQRLRTGLDKAQSRLQDLEEEISRLRSGLTGMRKDLRAAEHSAEVAERRLDQARARLARLTADT